VLFWVCVCDLVRAIHRKNRHDDARYASERNSCRRTTPSLTFGNSRYNRKMRRVLLSLQIFAGAVGVSIVAVLYVLGLMSSPEHLILLAGISLLVAPFAGAWFVFFLVRTLRRRDDPRHAKRPADAP